MDLNAQNQDSGAATAKPGDLQGTAASIVRDVLERAESSSFEAAKVKPTVAKIPQAAQAQLQQAVHAAAGAAASMRETERSAARSIEQYVRANPRRAVAIAFLTGLFVGRIVL
jgi:ElaB/YqjD/DUF883 family membrane-anchored ribosome-binding protein